MRSRNCGIIQALVAFAVIGLPAAGLSQAPSNVAPPAQSGASQTPKALLARVAQRIVEAKSITYDATVRFAGEDPGALRTFSVRCIEQEPNHRPQQFTEIRQNGKLIGIVGFGGPSGGIFYDPARKRYLKFANPTTDEEYGAVHAKLDQATGSDVAGNLFDFGLRHKPMLDVTYQYNRDSDVNYSVSNSTFDGRKVRIISSSTTGGGKPISEDVTLDSTDTLLRFSVSIDIGGKRLMVLDDTLTNLRFSGELAPSSVFTVRLPIDAKPFETSPVH